MAQLFRKLRIDDLQAAYIQFCGKVERLAPDSVLFQAEIRKLENEFSLLKQKIQYWDVLISYSRTIPESDEVGLARDRRMISNAIKNMDIILVNDAKFRNESMASRAAPYAGHDSFYSATSESDKENWTSRKPRSCSATATQHRHFPNSPELFSTPPPPSRTIPQHSTSSVQANRIGITNPQLPGSPLFIPATPETGSGYETSTASSSPAESVIENRTCSAWANPNHGAAFAQQQCRLPSSWTSPNLASTPVTKTFPVVPQNPVSFRGEGWIPTPGSSVSSISRISPFGPPLPVPYYMTESAEGTLLEDLTSTTKEYTPL